MEAHRVWLGAVVLAGLLAGTAFAGLPKEMAISIGVRETGSTAPIGDPGGVGGGIEFIDLDGQTLVVDGTWQEFTFHLPTAPVTAFAGATANGILEGSAGTIEHIRVRNFDGITDIVKLWVDEVSDTIDPPGFPPPVTVTFGGFEPPIALGSEYLFQEPRFSGSTDLHLMPTPNQVGVVDDEVFAGEQAYRWRWRWVDATDTRWVRLTTFRATILAGGDPTVSFINDSTVRFWLRAELEPVPALDIKPGSCPNPFNRTSHGVLPVALVGAETFDAALVDIATLRLSRADGVGGEVAPNEGPPGPQSEIEDAATLFAGAQCECHELEGDGIDDLSMKFRSDDVVAALELDALDPGALVELVVTGSFMDGGEFTSEGDCIRIVPPATTNGVLAVLSAHDDAWVDVSPLDDTLDGGGFGAFERSYPTGSVLTLTTPGTFGDLVFGYWEVNGNQVRSLGGRLVITLAEPYMTAEAVYVPGGPMPSPAPTSERPRLESLIR